MLRGCGLERLARYASLVAACCVSNEEGAPRDEVATGDFRLVPGPLQLARLQRRLRQAMRRCIKCQTKELDTHLPHQVKLLHERMAKLRTETRSNFEHLHVLTERVNTELSTASAAMLAMQAMMQDTLQAASAVAATGIPQRARTRASGSPQSPLGRRIVRADLSSMGGPASRLHVLAMAAKADDTDEGGGAEAVVAENLTERAERGLADKGKPERRRKEEPKEPEAPKATRRVPAATEQRERSPEGRGKEPPPGRQRRKPKTRVQAQSHAPAAASTSAEGAAAPSPPLAPSPPHAPSPGALQPLEA